MTTACSRYGLAAPSGRRSSKRPLPGTRTMCVRLLPVQVTLLGDQVAPESVRGALMRLYELTVGLVIAASASALYARNLYAFVETMIDKANNTLAVNWDDELVKATALTRDGAVIHPNFQPKT